MASWRNVGGANAGNRSMSDQNWRNRNQPLEYDVSSRSRTEYQQGNRRIVDSPEYAPVAHFLDDIKTGTYPPPTVSTRPRQQLIIPSAGEDTRILFANHYGDAFTELLRYEPKVMTFEKTTGNQTDTLNKVKSAVRDIIDDLHQETAGRYSLEIEFLKLIFTNPKPPNPPLDSELNSVDFSTLFKEMSSQLPRYVHRMCLDGDSEKEFLTFLEENGVAILNRIKGKDSVAVETYCRGSFSSDRDRIKATVRVNFDDLSFHRWNVCRCKTGSYTLPNPGNGCNLNMQIEGADIRLRGSAIYKVKLPELKEMAKELNYPFPSYLTSRNLGGQLERTGEYEFKTSPSSGITSIFLVTNRIKYEMSFNGIPFHLSIIDMRTFRRKNGSFVLDRCGIRWPRFRIPVPSKDSHEISNYVDTFSDLIMKMSNILSSGLISPKIWQLNVFHEGTLTRSLVFQRLRRRIVESESLTKMLDLPLDSSRNDIQTRLDSLLKAIGEDRVPLPYSTVDKLKQTAKSENFTI